jgi:hypothetical protein
VILFVFVALYHRICAVPHSNERSCNTPIEPGPEQALVDRFIDLWLRNVALWSRQRGMDPRRDERT